MKHLTSIRELTKESAISLLDNAQQLSQVNDREVKKLPALRGKTVVNLFFENSTRTRISFEVAAKRLSADVINFSADTSSVSKGESLKDTAQTLEALGADAIVLRHPFSGAPKLLAEQDWISASVINAGDGSHEHPTQALLDALTIRQGFSLASDLAGVNVLIVGDIRHSRVARSNILLLNLLGAKVAVAGPESLIPSGIEAMGARVSHAFDEALSAKPDVVRKQGGAAHVVMPVYGIGAPQHRNALAVDLDVAARVVGRDQAQVVAQRAGVRVAVLDQAAARRQLGEHGGLDRIQPAHQLGGPRAQLSGGRVAVLVPLQVEALPVGLEAGGRSPAAVAGGVAAAAGAGATAAAGAAPGFFGSAFGLGQRPSNTPVATDPETWLETASPT